MRVTPQCDTISTIAICNRSRVQTDPSIVFNGQNYIVVWSDFRFTDREAWLVAARVTPQGTILDTGNIIGAEGDFSEVLSDVAFDGNRCLAVWYYFDSLAYGIYGRFINSQAQPEGPIITIGLTAFYKMITPKIAFDGNNYLVVWQDLASDSSFDIFGQRVSNEGQLVGSLITIGSGSSNQMFPDLVYDDNYLVVWVEDSYIYGQQVNTNGELVGSKFRICDNTSYTRDYPTVAASNNYRLVAWEERRGSYDDIYGNAYIPVAVEDEAAGRLRNYVSTIFTGPISLPEGKNCKIYDISGREVRSVQLKPGVYFIEVEGKISQKVIKIR